MVKCEICLRRGDKSVVRAGEMIWETFAWACSLLFPSQHLRLCPGDSQEAFVEDHLAQNV